MLINSEKNNMESIPLSASSSFSSSFFLSIAYFVKVYIQIIHGSSIIIWFPQIYIHVLSLPIDLYVFSVEIDFFGWFFET